MHVLRYTGLVLVLLATVFAGNCDGAAVGGKSSALSRVKRGSKSPKSCQKSQDSSSESREKGEVPVVMDCTCSFDECSCKDRSEKRSRKPKNKSSGDSNEWLEELLKDMHWSKGTAADEPEVKAPKAPKAKKPTKDKGNGTGRPGKRFFDQESEEDAESGEEDKPETGKKQRKQTFEEYYQTRRRQEILDYLKNYYSKSN